MESLAPRLSYYRTQRCRGGPQECPRDRSSRLLGVRFIFCREVPHSLRQLFGRGCTKTRTFCFGGRKERLVLEGVENIARRLHISSDRQGLGRSSNNQLGDH